MKDQKTQKKPLRDVIQETRELLEGAKRLREDHKDILDEVKKNLEDKK